MDAPREVPVGGRVEGSNVLRTSKYTVASFLPRYLFEAYRHVSNMYFTAVLCIQLIPGEEQTATRGGGDGTCIHTYTHAFAAPCAQCDQPLVAIVSPGLTHLLL